MIDLKNEMAFYQSHLANGLLPFWNKAEDRRYGGVFTCFNNMGTKLISRDKYVWSQGRMAWVYARLAKDIARGTLTGVSRREAERYLQSARRTCVFLRDHALLPENDGVCAYLLTEDGQKKECVSGKGYYTSFFVDCFVVLGFSEYALAAQDEEFLNLALTVYDRSVRLIQSGRIVTEPYPIAEGFVSHAVDMILTITTNSLWHALRAAAHPRAGELNEKSLVHAYRILNLFYQREYGVIQELKPLHNKYADTFSARHIMPGHALESMWFCLHILKENAMPLDERLFIASRNSLSLGWDKEYGGLLRCVDMAGGPPRGRRLLNDPYEALMEQTWDTKLWWPHSEALYMTLLCNVVTKDSFFEEYYYKIAEYVKAHFINPNLQVGEWIQILTRQGTCLNQVVALPVKDPFHIIRNVLLLIELLSAVSKEDSICPLL